MKVTALSEKAMLVKLTMRQANLTRRDGEAERVIQLQMDDTSLVVTSRLFRDKNSPIQKILSAAGEIYTYHKKHTLPYVDKGPRILPTATYMEYSAAMHNKIAQVDHLLQQHMPNYDVYVQRDIQLRSHNAITRAKVDDYPSAEEFKARMGFDLRFYPMPDERHFLFDLSEDDMQGFTRSMHEAAAAAREDAIKRMMTPLKHLAAKLAVPAGQEGSVFRDSAVENVLEGAELARKLNIDASPEITAITQEVEQLVGRYATNPDLLRDQPTTREAARKKLDEIAAKMGAYMGAT